MNNSTHTHTHTEKHTTNNNKNKNINNTTTQKNYKIFKQIQTYANECSRVNTKQKKTRKTTNPRYKLTHTHPPHTYTRLIIRMRLRRFVLYDIERPKRTHSRHTNARSRGPARLRSGGLGRSACVRVSATERFHQYPGE